MLLMRNITILPLVILLRTIPMMLWVICSRMAKWLERWHDKLDDWGIFLKRWDD